jgi:hypothetical protein
MNELAKIYREMAARYRQTAESFRLWPDEARHLIGQAEACDAKADQVERQRPTDEH